MKAIIWILLGLVVAGCATYQPGTNLMNAATVICDRIHNVPNAQADRGSVEYRACMEKWAQNVLEAYVSKNDNPQAYQTLMMMRANQQPYQPIQAYQMPVQQNVHCNTWHTPGASWGTVDCR